MFEPIISALDPVDRFLLLGDLVSDSISEQHNQILQSVYSSEVRNPA